MNNFISSDNSKIEIAMGLAYASPSVKQQINEIFANQELVGESGESDVVMKLHDHCTWYRGSYMDFSLMDDTVIRTYPDSFRIEKYYTNLCTLYRIFDSKEDYVWHKLKYE